MAHFQQLEFVRIVRTEMPQYFSNVKVVEIGSWDVNGSVRNSFTDCNYLGVDIAQGTGVDFVSQGEDLSFPSETFDVVISCECFEHNAQWAKTFSNMIRMLKPGGLCVITCATLGRSEHGTKRTNADASLTAIHNYPDYYQNLAPRDFKRNVDLDQHFHPYRFFLNAYSKDLYFLGVKKTEPKSVDFFKPRLIDRIKNIRRAKHTSFASQLNYKLKFFYRYILASSLGEHKYHNLKHRLRKNKI